MPLPLLALAIPWLIAAVEALAQRALRAALVYAAEVAWERVKPLLLNFCREQMPETIVWAVGKYLGVEIAAPIGPHTITQIVNAKIAESGLDLVLLDVTDADQVKSDIREWAIGRMCAAVPGVMLRPEYLANNESAKEKLRKCIYGGVKREIVATFQGQEGYWITAEQGAAMVAQLQSQYDYEPKETADDTYHIVSRQMAGWYRRHLRKHWVPR